MPVYRSNQDKTIYIFYSQVVLFPTRVTATLRKRNIIIFRDSRRIVGDFEKRGCEERNRVATDGNVHEWKGRK